MNGKIIALGDSIMKGVTVSKNSIDSCKMEYHICKENFAEKMGTTSGKELINLSRFGSTIKVGYKDLSRHLDKIKSGDSVILEFGGNDCNLDWESIANNPSEEHLPQTSLSDFSIIYKTMINTIRERNATPILLSLPPLDEKRFFNFVSNGKNGGNILSWLGGSIRYIYTWHEQYNLEVFKIANSESVKIIDITSAFLQLKDYSEYLCDDGMHPNEKGHNLISKLII